MLVLVSRNRLWFVAKETMVFGGIYEILDGLTRRFAKRQAHEDPISVTSTQRRR